MNYPQQTNQPEGYGPEGEASSQGLGQNYGAIARQESPSTDIESAAGQSGEQNPLRKKACRESVSQSDSVYSAILFLPAVSRLKTGKAQGLGNWKESNRAAKLAMVLVFLNALLQIGVVQVIGVYDHVYRLAETQQLIMPSEVADYGDHILSDYDREFNKGLQDTHADVHKSTLLPNELTELESAESISPLCYRSKGMLYCTPHSVLYAHSWEELDTDKNGIWTLKEAKADIKHLKEKHRGVSPETIFNNMINGLRKSRQYEELRGNNRTLYLTADVDNEIAIPKAYFDYWAGDAMMCSFFDPTSCEAAAQAGVFEEALRPGRISADSKAIYDLDSAIQYCYRMLNAGGGCEHLLPTEFKSNREQRWERCGDASLTEGGKYVNPYDLDQSVHVLKATYSNLTALTRASSRLYLFFLCLILMLWFLVQIDEWRELLKFGEFLAVYPDIKPGTMGGEITETDDGDEDTPMGVSYKIEGLSTKHRCVLALVFIMRLDIAILLLALGTRFLLVETDYINLVLNSLALAFILEIDSVLYSLFESSTRDEVSRCRPLTFPTSFPQTGLGGYCLKKECWGLFLIPIASVSVVLYFNFRDKEPVLEALTCACIQEGKKCLDSPSINIGWWKEYWSHVLPAAMHQIEAFRFAGA